MLFACVMFSTLSGLCTTVSVNILQYGTHMEMSGKWRLTAARKAVLYALNIVIGLSGIGLFVLATGSGPVSVAMPITTGMGVFLNMLVQIALGIERYTKPMRVGTFILFAAVMALIDLGPEEQEYEDPLALVLTTAGTVASALQLGLLIAGFVLIAVFKDADNSSLWKNVGYAVVVALSTSIGASVGKVMQMPMALPARVAAVLSYLVCGLISFGMAAVAATETDVALNMPLRSCVQLIANAATGVAIWQDWRVLKDWDAYICVYIIIVSAVYEVSSFDFFPVDMPGPPAIASFHAGDAPPFNIAMEKCLCEWGGASGNEQVAASRFQEMLHVGLESRNINQNAIVDLAMMLVRKHHEAKPTEDLLAWTQANVPKVDQYFQKNGNSFHRRSFNGEEALEMRTSRDRLSSAV